MTTDELREKFEVFASNGLTDKEAAYVLRKDEDGNYMSIAAKAGFAAYQAAHEELQGEIEHLTNLLAHSKCPDCNGSGAIQISESEIEQCRFCDEKYHAINKD